MMDAQEVYDRYAAGEKNFRELTFENVNFNIAQLEEPSPTINVLDEIDFSGARFESCDLSYVNFRRAKFVGTLTNGCVFLCTNFSNADLRKCRFEFSDYVVGANFTDADLREARIDGPLDGANFTRANLKGGSISGGGEDIICCDTIMPDGSKRSEIIR